MIFVLVTFVLVTFVLVTFVLVTFVLVTCPSDFCPSDFCPSDFCPSDFCPSILMNFGNYDHSDYNLINSHLSYCYPNNVLVNLVLRLILVLLVPMILVS